MNILISKYMFLSLWAALISFVQDSADSLANFLSTSTVQETSIMRENTNPSLESPETKRDVENLPTIASQTGVARRSSYLGRIREADRLIEHEYYAEAATELSLATQEKPTVLTPFLLLGDIYIRTKNTNKLKFLIAELKQKFPNRSEIAVLEARLRILNNDFQGMKYFVTSLAEPVPARVRLYEAMLLALQNNHTQAKKILQSLQSLEEKPYALEVGSSGVKESTQQEATISPELAIVVENLLERYATFEKLSEGKNAHLFALLGKALGDIDETVLVREFADVSLQEDASYIDAWVLRGYSYFLEKQFELALDDFYQAYRLDPIRPQTHYFLALTLTELGKNKEAIVFFEKALAHDFEFSNDVNWKLVTLFEKEEKYDRVVDLYQRLLSPDTERKKISQAFHVLIDKADSPKVALNLAESFIVENFDDVFLLNMYAWSLIANNNFDRAEEMLEQADELIPKHPQTHLNLGLLYETQEEFKKAKEHYKRSYEYGKMSPEFVSLANFAARKYNNLP